MAASTVVHSGNDGVFSIGGTAIQKILSFEISEEESVDGRIDGMGDDWEDSVGIKFRYSGTLETRRLQSDTAGPVALGVGDEISFAAYPDGDTTDLTEISGTARVTGVTHGADQESTNNITLSFKGKGALVKGVKS